MSWFVWLGLAVIVTAIAAVTSMQPKGARPVSGTHMMGMARAVLVVLALIFAYLAFQARSGG
jgi:hypothetical protein